MTVMSDAISRRRVCTRHAAAIALEAAVCGGALRVDGATADNQRRETHPHRRAHFPQGHRQRHTADGYGPALVRFLFAPNLSSCQSYVDVLLAGSPAAVVLVVDRIRICHTPATFFTR